MCRFVLETYFVPNEEIIKRFFVEKQQIIRDLRYVHLDNLMKEYIKTNSDASKKQARECIQKTLHRGMKNFDQTNFLTLTKEKEVFLTEKPLFSVPDYIDFDHMRYVFAHSVLLAEQNEMIYFYKQPEKKVHSNRGIVTAEFVPDIGKEKEEALMNTIFEKLIESNRLQTLFE